MVTKTVFPAITALSRRVWKNFSVIEMIADKKTVDTAVAACLENGKGKKKFVQSVDLAIGFKEMDFSKPENRLSVEVVLPHAPKQKKVAVFADGNLAFDAKNHADLVIASTEIAVYAGDKKKQKELLDYGLLAAPQLMAQVGKQLGQVLGSKGKLPKPIPPNANLQDLVQKTKKSVLLKSKGKHLPALHCIIGNENMKPEEISENVSAVLDAVEKVVAQSKVKSVFIKTTMGKPAKVM